MTLKDLTEKRAAAVEKMEALLNVEGDLTDEQTAEFDQLEKDIEGLDKTIAKRKTLDGLKASHAIPATPEPVSKNDDLPGSPRVEIADPDKGRKGATFSKITRALAASKGIPQVAALHAANVYGENHPATKALAASVGVSGGFLVPEQYSQDIIELLRARAIVRQAGPITIPINGTYLMPRLASGSTGGYIGENQNIAATEPTFGQLRLTSKKLAALVPISNDLLKTASPAADDVVVNDLVSSLANTEDAAFLRDTGVGNAPRGMRSWAAAGNLFNSAGDAIANVEADLRNARNRLLNANVRMTRPAWFMSPRDMEALRFIRDANGNRAFPEVGETQRLIGVPIFASNNIPINLGGGNDSEVYLVDMADAVIGEEQGIELMVSDTAAYHDGANVVAAFSLDQTVIRAILKHDFVMRHAASVCVIEQVTWGN